MKRIILFFLLLSLAAVAAPKQSLRSEILAKLPSELTKLSKSTNAAELKKMFGSKIKKSEEATLYLNYFSKQNDVTIGLEDKKFRYLYLKTPQTLKKDYKNLFKEVYLTLGPSEQRDLLSSGSISHEGGRYIQIDLPKESLSLRFRNNENKDLDSILFWEPGENKP